MAAPPHSVQKIGLFRHFSAIFPCPTATSAPLQGREGQNCMAASDDRIHKKGIPSHLFCAIMILQKSLGRARKTKGSTIMSDIMQFSDRAEFRQWLSDNCRSGAGVWLLFGKAGGPRTIGAEDDRGRGSPGGGPLLRVDRRPDAEHRRHCLR